MEIIKNEKFNDTWLIKPTRLRLQRPKSQESDYSRASSIRKYEAQCGPL